MANWVAIIDPDETRRRVASADVDSRLCPVPGLVTDTISGLDWTIAWAASKLACVDVARDDDCVAIVWGEARDGNGALQRARDIQAGWRHGAREQWDGYYAAAVVDEAERSFFAGVDILGYYPLYHWTNGDGVVLVGSSPGLFCAHPEFSAEIDLRGVIGILLTNGLVNGKCLWKNVRRAGPGNLVSVIDGKVQEEKVYEIPLDADADDLPFDGHLQMLDEELGAAMRRHVPADSSCGLMLSGGLDSRLLGGYLARQGSDVNCLTFGVSQDIEMRCARHVAKRLGFAHHFYEVPYSDYAVAAVRSARMEVLTSGFGGVMEWAIQKSVAKVSDRIVVGHALDGVLGGIHIGWAYDSRARSMGFDELLPTILAWGIGPDELGALLEPEVTSVVTDVMNDLRAEYDTVANREHHRAWLFDIYHRQRFHVGSAFLPISLGTWPVSPVFDRSLIAACASLPGTSIASRRMQIELLKQRFPELSGLPLDRNSSDMMPLLPQLKDFVMRSVNYRWDTVRSNIRRLMGWDEPNVYYYKRIYNFDSPGWRSIRKLTQDHRMRVKAILSKADINDLMPDPESCVQAGRTIKETSLQRTVAGLALCLSEMMSSGD